MGNGMFGDNWAQGILGGLEALDKRAENYAHDRQFTADGVKLEKGLEVWCVDHAIGDVPWKIGYISEKGSEYRISKDGSEPGTTRNRDAEFRVMYHDVFKAISARMDVLAKKKKEIIENEINPIHTELGKLSEMAAKHGGLREKEIECMLENYND